MSQHNSSITAAAYSLGVNPDALAAWLDQVAPRPGSKPKNALSEIGNKMAIVLEKHDPDLAQEWRMANYFTHRPTRQ